MNRVALVTGGGGGIGAAIARSLAGLGTRVAVADLNGATAEAIADEIGGDAIGVVMDVTDPQSVSSAIDEVRSSMGAIDICVNSAGWEAAKPFVETDDDFVERILQVNLIGAMRVCRHVMPDMTERQWGRIINISSEAGRIGAPRSAPYAAAKGGMIAFSKSIAAEVAPSQVTVNCISPGAIDTPLLYSSQGESAEKVMRFLSRAIPLGRVGEPKDVSALAAFLASDSAGYITGQTLSVNGGLTMI